MAQLTDSSTCAECGTGITIQTILDEDAGPLAVNIRGHRIEIPGLFVCTPCAGAIMVGEKESTVTLEAIVTFFNDEFGPKLVGAVMLADNERMADMAAVALAYVMELQTALEAVIALRDETGGLDSIPECDGKCGQPHTPEHGQDKSLAYLN